jgi:hypothetical protein
MDADKNKLQSTETAEALKNFIPEARKERKH